MSTLLVLVGIVIGVLVALGVLVWLFVRYYLSHTGDDNQ